MIAEVVIFNKDKPTFIYGPSNNTSIIRLALASPQIANSLPLMIIWALLSTGSQIYLPLSISQYETLKPLTRNIFKLKLASM